MECQYDMKTGTSSRNTDNSPKSTSWQEYQPRP